MARYLIIDGYNAINRIGVFVAEKDISLEAARTSFIRVLQDFMTQSRRFDKVFVVFDSKEKDIGGRRHSYGKVEILFGTDNRDADSVIVDMLKNISSPDRISVSSDDNFVRNHAKVFSCDVICIRDLEKEIILKRKKVETKIDEKKLKTDKINNINEELRKHWGIV